MTELNSNTTITQTDINGYAFPVTISGSGLVITLGEDIVLNAVDHYFIIGSSNVTFDGNYNTVTISNVPDYLGLIKNGLESNAYDNVTVQNIGIITSGSSTLFEDGGWVGHQYFGNNSTPTTAVLINNCYSTGAIGERAGGITGRYSSGNATNCYSTGTIGSHAGGITGGDWSGTATNCYSTGTIGRNAGGITGFRLSGTVTNCYSTGTIDKYAGGITGFNSSGTATNCYSTGTIDQYAGGITGSFSATPVTNCYSTGTINPDAGGIIGSGSPGTVTNCISKGTNIWSSVNANTALSGEDGSIWITSNSFSNGYGLTVFNESPWDVDTSYISNNSNAVFAGVVSSVSGDPHVTTLTGQKYDLITKNYFRLFDNNNVDNRFIVNCYVSKFPLKTWEHMEYIKAVCIKFNNRTCVVSTGFRGEKAKILQNDGDFEIKDTSLTLHENYKGFCSECKYKNRNKKLMARHRRNASHILLNDVRNSLTFSINTTENIYTFEIMNVDEDNFNPCQVQLKIHNKLKYGKYSGAITKKMEPYSCDVDGLHDDCHLKIDSSSINDYVKLL
jgi:hypothetical protein